MLTFRNIELPESTTVRDLKVVASDYEAICITTMRAIVERYQATAGYPYVDTKLNLISGQDFADDDPIRGQGAVYGWIQGRGLEALAGHARWLRDKADHSDLVAQIDPMLREILDNLRRVRDGNDGHVCFFMTPEGAPFTLDSRSQPVPFAAGTVHPYGFSDQFSSKGMFAAADYLGDDGARAEALEYVNLVEASMWDRTFTTDQIALDPINRVEYKAGARAHGHLMIQLGAPALLVESGIEGAIERGLKIVEHELMTYVNLDGRIADLQEGDLWENVDDDGQPYLEADGSIFSDPGHSLEFVGLAAKFIAIAEGACESSAQTQRLVAAKRRLPRVLGRNFDNGYFPGPRGISKGFDLISRTHVNTDMPWWNLPETIRAAAYCLSQTDVEEEKAMCLRVFRDAHNAMLHYLRPDLNLMAYQTRDAAGQPVDLIPATADADPGYHTGLSLIDTIGVIESL
jgi:mannose/cellobiose epimerase-like protein (N-acyl-D-glucosamine 2-epimerase family)